MRPHAKKKNTNARKFDCHFKIYHRHHFDSDYHPCPCMDGGTNQERQNRHSHGPLWQLVAGLDSYWMVMVTDTWQQKVINQSTFIATLDSQHFRSNYSMISYQFFQQNIFHHFADNKHLPWHKMVHLAKNKPQFS